MVFHFLLLLPQPLPKPQLLRICILLFFIACIQ
nr:MAG TPA: hypothetical protein [Caudoviricetes sp.]